MKYFIILITLLSFGCIDEIILKSNTDAKFTPETYGYPYLDIKLDIDKNRNISIWHVFSNNPRGTILIIPGLSSSKSSYARCLNSIVPHNFNVVMMDYEGYGSSSGNPDFENFVEDAFAAARYAIDSDDHIIGYGISLGTPILAKVASEIKFKGCIFDSILLPYDEASLWLKNKGLPLFPSTIIANTIMWPQIPPNYCTICSLRLIDSPKLFIQSVDDNVTPYDGAIIAYASSSEPKSLWSVTGNHATYMFLNTVEYQQKVFDWISNLDL